MATAGMPGVVTGKARHLAANDVGVPEPLQREDTTLPLQIPLRVLALSPVCGER